MTRSEAIARHRAAGGKVLAVFPGRYPRAVVEALGWLPVEVWDPPDDGRAAAGHIQPFACSVARRAAGFVLSGRCLADALLFPHTCDTLQNLFTVLRDLVGLERPCFLFNAPRAAQSKSAESFLTAAIAKLAAELAQAAGAAGARCAGVAAEPEESRMAAAAQARGEADAAMATLYAQRAAGRLTCSNAEFYGVVRSHEFLPPAQFCAEVERFLAAPSPPRRWKLTAVLSGILPDRGLLDAMDRAGILILEDDLLSCGRRFSRAADAPFAPWHLPPCTSAGSPLAERARFLDNLLAASGARSVVFHAVKFCEPELFDHPFLLEHLARRSTPAIVVESEVGDAATAGLATRLEAFVETAS